jgi:hypothetical protein
MKTLVTGSNKSGSWDIRGEQLGAAINATVRNKVRDAKGFERVILVKRAYLEERGDAHIVWDIVDAWPQPHGNAWDRETLIDWTNKRAKRLGVHALVAATHRMADDLRSIGIPTIALPHHYRPGIEINPIRRKVRRIGYEGAPHYLGRWEAILRQICASREWEFVMNPCHLADVDIVVALREPTGYATTYWKSNVKLANAQGSGTPVILTPEAGYIETQSGAEYWAESEEDLDNAFELLTDYDRRVTISSKLRSVAPELNAIARRYISWLEQLKS